MLELIIILVLVLISMVPLYPYIRGWGYAPSGLTVLILLCVLILVLTGRI